MTKQEIFDKVAPALLKQNEKCGIQDETGFKCRYEHEGKRCAVGFLIPDGHPALKYSGGAYSLVENFPELGFKPNQHLLNDLQHIHDAIDPKQWKLNLLELVKHHDLDAECISDV